MLLSREIKQAIYIEYNSFKQSMYAGKTLEERQQLDQFFTPPEITIPMIEKFNCDSLVGKNILDPTSGSGNLLAACLIAGADADKVYGNDYDAKMVTICKTRLKALCEQLGKEGFRYFQIHQGNALHYFCLNCFDPNYDVCYFGNGKDLDSIVTTPKCIENRLNSDENNLNALTRFKRYDKGELQNAFEENGKKLKEESQNNKIKENAKNVTDMWD